MSKKVKIIIFLVIIISLIYVNEQKYEEMYEMLSETSKSNISKEDFVKRNQKRTQKVEH